MDTLALVRSTAPAMLATPEQTQRRMASLAVPSMWRRGAEAPRRGRGGKHMRPRRRASLRCRKREGRRGGGASVNAAMLGKRSPAWLNAGKSTAHTHVFLMLRPDRPLRHVKRGRALNSATEASAESGTSVLRIGRSLPPERRDTRRMGSQAPPGRRQGARTRTNADKSCARRASDRRDLNRCGSAKNGGQGRQPRYPPEVWSWVCANSPTQEVKKTRLRRSCSRGVAQCWAHAGERPASRCISFRELLRLLLVQASTSVSSTTLILLSRYWS